MRPVESKCSGSDLNAEFETSGSKINAAAKPHVSSACDFRAHVPRACDFRNTETNLEG